MQGLEPYPSYPLSIVAVMQFVLWGWVTICLQYTAGYITANFFVFKHILPLVCVAAVALVIPLYKARCLRLTIRGGYEYPVPPRRLTKALPTHP